MRSEVLVERISKSPEETEELGRALASVLRPGEVVALEGELGTGKTVFVRGMARGLGVKGPIRSPSFTLISLLKGRLELVHVDAYRIKRAEELIEAGIEEILDSGAVVAIEWAEKVRELLPERRVHLRFYHLDEGRRIEIEDLGLGLAHRKGAEEFVDSRD